MQYGAIIIFRYRYRNHKAWISKWFFNSGFRFGFWSFWILMENNICDTVGSVSHARDICFSQFMLNNNVDHVGHRQISNQTKNMLILISEHMWWWVQDKIRNAYFLNLCVFIPSRINCVAFSFCLYCESRTVSEYILNKHRTVEWHYWQGNLKSWNTNLADYSPSAIYHSLLCLCLCSMFS